MSVLRDSQCEVISYRLQFVIYLIGFWNDYITPWIVRD